MTELDSLPVIKRRKRITQHHQQTVAPEDESTVAAAAAAALIPGLPDHIAQICLYSINPSLIYSVNRSWRRLLSSPSFPPYLSLYALLSPDLPAQSSTTITTTTTAAAANTTNRSVEFFNFDPITSNWTQLPPRPPSIRFTLQHKSFLSLNLPIQSLSVAGKLVVVAATDPLLRPALDCPLIFDPVHRLWSYGPEMAYPRRWCAAGSSGGAVYVASGVGSQFKTIVSKSVERWRFDDVEEDKRHQLRWEKMKAIKDGKLSREAIEAIGCRGKLYMVNVKGNAAKEGFVYDTAKDEWEDMSEGMLGGWRGPAASMNEEDIYVVDDKRGVLMMYEWNKDAWCEILHSELLIKAEQMAAAGGRICVVIGGSGKIVVVDVTRGTPSVWTVEMPDGFRANSVHVLPRMV